MTLLLGLLALLPQQLTWYETYEQGERKFQKGEYRQCIVEMDRALALMPTPKRNQFTRAVQKIDYKPFYYKALAHYRLRNIEAAYASAQQSFNGEVVLGNPVLQNDLTDIYVDYRGFIQEQQTLLEGERQLLQGERNLIQERAAILKLISQGSLAEADSRMATLQDGDMLSELRSLADRQRRVQNQESTFVAKITSDINQLLQGQEPIKALALLQAGRSYLDQEVINEWDSRIQAAISSREAETLNQSQEEENSAQAVFDSELYQKELASAKAEIDLITAEKNELFSRIESAESDNQRLSEALATRVAEEPELGEPRAFLMLNQELGRQISVKGHAVTPASLQSWELLLDGEEVVLASANVEQDFSGVRLEGMVDTPSFGNHLLEFRVIDAQGRQARVTEALLLARPWWLMRWLHTIVIALIVLAGCLLLWRRFVRRRRARLRHFNPYIAGSPVRETGMFFGRERLLNRIHGQAHKNCFMIHGERRIGKTSLLLQLKKSLVETTSDDYGFYPAFMDLQGVAEVDLFHHLMAEMLSQAQDWPLEFNNIDLAFQEANQGYGARHFSRDLKRLIQGLKNADGRHVMVIMLVDEVDVLNEFDDKTNQKLRSIFMKEYAEHLGCVMAGIHLKKEWESSGSPWYNFFEEIPMDPIGERAARKLILEPVRGIFHYSRGAVELILRSCAGHPYLIQKMCVSLVDKNLQGNRFTIGKKDVLEYLDQLKRETGGGRVT